MAFISIYTYFAGVRTAEIILFLQKTFDPICFETCPGTNNCLITHLQIKRPKIITTNQIFSSRTPGVNSKYFLMEIGQAFHCITLYGRPGPHES